MKHNVKEGRVLKHKNTVPLFNKKTLKLQSSDQRGQGEGDLEHLDLRKHTSLKAFKMEAEDL